MVVQLTDADDDVTTVTPKKKSYATAPGTSVAANEIQDTPEPDKPDFVRMSKEELKMENAKFAHRRRMAYISLFSILVFTALLFFHIEPERIKALETATTWFYMAMSSIVGFYMGAATWSQITSYRINK